MLRGGMDGLLLFLIGNNILTKARPDIGVDKPIKITADFALHPMLKITNLYGIKDKHLYFMHRLYLILEDHILKDKI